MEILPTSLLFGSPAHLLPPSASWSSTIASWIAEDCPNMDWGGFVVGEDEKIAVMWCKKNGVVAGQPFVTEIFKQLDCTVDWHIPEGAYISLDSRNVQKFHVATVKGKARNLLLGERVALNTLARCSGIATKSRALLVASREAGFKGIIAGTRKTTPGFRLVEKYGMIVGGVDPHRYDLSQMVMLKDNHVWSKGSIHLAISSLQSLSSFSLKIHVETSSLLEALEAIKSGADIIMLDNFTGEELVDALKVLKTRKEEGWMGGKWLVEVSGGITDQNLKEYALDGVDILSTSSIHQGVPIIDFSLKIAKSTFNES